MKKVAIYYLGQPLKYIYPHATRFQVLKYHVRIATRRLFIIATFLAALAAAYAVGALPHNQQLSFSRPLSAAAFTEFSTRNNDDKIAGAKALFFHELSSLCESPNYKPGDDGIINDTNNKASVGPFKFQITTMQYYYNQIHHTHITRAEAVTIAMDYTQAEEVADYVWFQTDNGPRDWVNCSNWHDLVDKAAFIKSL